MNDCFPGKDCALCTRLAEFREMNRRAFPDKFNAPVPSFGLAGARLLIVGLAPGLRGANFTGRPFTGDYAGDLLYSTLLRFGFASGRYGASPDDGLVLHDCRITNAVRCVPPENKPVGKEISACNEFLKKEIAAMPGLQVIVSLGLVSHNAVLKALGMRGSVYPFAHGASHRIVSRPLLVDSYHCSRYNTQTGRLTNEMFNQVFSLVAAELGIKSPPPSG